MQKNQGKVYIRNKTNQVSQAKAGTCLRQQINSTRIDIIWNFKQGDLIICYSKQQYFSRVVSQETETLKGVLFKHSNDCPFLNEKIQKNPARPVKACSLVLLIDPFAKIFLLNKRNQKLSMSGAIVVPGGHLQSQQTIINGGLRQCIEEVGMPIEKGIFHQENQVLAWQRVHVVDGKIKAVGLLLYFTALCQKFQVKADQRQISGYFWKNIQDSSHQQIYQQAKGGYSEGLLEYLRFVRQKTIVNAINPNQVKAD